MKSREIVRRSLYFKSLPRLPYSFHSDYGTDIVWVDLHPSPDGRLNKGVDEWGCVWDSAGVSSLGEVKESPLKDWEDFSKLAIPNIQEEHRYEAVKKAREESGDKYILLNLISIYERVHFIRGFENAQIDVIECPKNIKMMVNLLADMNIEIIRRCADYDLDGICMYDDWGLQDRLMINPVYWREIWKPVYKKIYDEAHNAGLDVFLHSCGYIADILEDLIEIGLNAIHMDQQENMGLELLGNRFGGRINFFSPVDIQNTMVFGSSEDIKNYCHEMWRTLGSTKGGLIPRWYADPVGAGHMMENVNIMCEEFLAISKKYFI